MSQERSSSASTSGTQKIPFINQHPDSDSSEEESQIVLTDTQQKLHEFIHQNNLEKIKTVKITAPDILIRNSKGQSALHLAWENPEIETYLYTIIAEQKEDFKQDPTLEIKNPKADFLAKWLLIDLKFENNPEVFKKIFWLYIKSESLQNIQDYKNDSLSIKGYEDYNSMQARIHRCLFSSICNNRFELIDYLLIIEKINLFEGFLDRLANYVCEDDLCNFYSQFKSHDILIKALIKATRFDQILEYIKIMMEFSDPGNPLEEPLENQIDIPLKVFEYTLIKLTEYPDITKNYYSITTNESISETLCDMYTKILVDNNFAWKKNLKSYLYFLVGENFPIENAFTPVIHCVNNYQDKQMDIINFALLLEDENLFSLLLKKSGDTNRFGVTGRIPTIADAENFYEQQYALHFANFKVENRIYGSLNEEEQEETSFDESSSDSEEAGNQILTTINVKPSEEAFPKSPASQKKINKNPQEETNLSWSSKYLEASIRIYKDISSFIHSDNPTSFSSLHITFFNFLKEGKVEEAKKLEITFYEILTRDASGYSALHLVDKLPDPQLKNTTFSYFYDFLKSSDNYAEIKKSKIHKLTLISHWLEYEIENSKLNIDMFKKVLDLHFLFENQDKVKQYNDDIITQQQDSGLQWQMADFLLRAIYNNKPPIIEFLLKNSGSNFFKYYINCWDDEFEYTKDSLQRLKKIEPHECVINTLIKMKRYDNALLYLNALLRYALPLIKENDHYSKNQKYHHPQIAIFAVKKLHESCGHYNNYFSLQSDHPFNISNLIILSFNKTRFGEELSTQWKEALKQYLYFLLDNPFLPKKYFATVDVINAAIQLNDQDLLLKLLKNSANPNFINASGQTSLFTAIRLNRTHMIHCLVIAGAVERPHNDKQIDETSPEVIKIRELIATEKSAIKAQENAINYKNELLLKLQNIQTKFMSLEKEITALKDKVMSAQQCRLKKTINVEGFFKNYSTEIKADIFEYYNNGNQIETIQEIHINLTKINILIEKLNTENDQVKLKEIENKEIAPIEKIHAQFSSRHKSRESKLKKYQQWASKNLDNLSKTKTKKDTEEPEESTETHQRYEKPIASSKDKYSLNKFANYSSFSASSGSNSSAIGKNKSSPAITNSASTTNQAKNTQQVNIKNNTNNNAKNPPSLKNTSSTKSASSKPKEDQSHHATTSSSFTTSTSTESTVSSSTTNLEENYIPYQKNSLEPAPQKKSIKNEKQQRILDAAAEDFEIHFCEDATDFKKFSEKDEKIWQLWSGYYIFITINRLYEAYLPENDKELTDELAELRAYLIRYVFELESPKIQEARDVIKRMSSLFKKYYENKEMNKNELKKFLTIFKGSAFWKSLEKIRNDKKAKPDFSAKVNVALIQKAFNNITSITKSFLTQEAPLLPFRIQYQLLFNDGECYPAIKMILVHIDLLHDELLLVKTPMPDSIKNFFAPTGYGEKFNLEIIRNRIAHQKGRFDKDISNYVKYICNNIENGITASREWMELLDSRISPRQRTLSSFKPAPENETTTSTLTSTSHPIVDTPTNTEPQTTESIVGNSM
jgi:hypothetical protein